MKTKKDLYDQLFELSKTIATQASIQLTLEWDQETYMPSDAADLRASQLSLLAGQIHKNKTSPKFSHLLNQLIDLDSGEVLDPALPPEKKAALREWRRDHLKAIKLPTAFVKTLTAAVSTATHVWADAKKHSKFAQFAPHLEKIVQLNRKKAEFLGYENHPYDALLDLYEPGMTTAQLTPLFDQLKTTLKDLVKTIQQQPPLDTQCLKGEFSPAIQLQFGKKLLKAMGFLPENSRLDLSNHPFCIPIHPHDTRMTTRIDPHELMSSVSSVMHEGGHGLYNQNLLVQYFGSPLCEQVSLGIDESQSRFWETRIGQSLPFWTHFLPQLHHDFPHLKATLDPFYRAINTVFPSFIRIDADEVTYSLHVILRFEIEKALLEGSLKVKDVPAVWNQKMHDFLGITPSDDAHGCLQDIHWASGLIGYFPTYVLGNLYASQFFTIFEKTHPDWASRLSKGDLAFIREWLKHNIHQYGRQFTPDELVKRITGKPLDASAYVEYLTKKYREIYGF